jgi:hypothetical protein
MTKSDAQSLLLHCRVIVGYGDYCGFGYGCSETTKTTTTVTAAADVG